ncbi:MAG: phosphatase PAP2 family protein [Thermoanaerobaculia bacterium]
MLRTRAGLTVLLGLIFIANIVETAAEDRLKETYGLGTERAYDLSYASHRAELGFSFELHDTTNLIAAYGYSLSYFFVYPIIGVALAIALGRWRRIEAFRVYMLGLAIDYLLSLPFFLFFPVLERWAYPRSGAMLLSDKVTETLIEAFRPMSGLDNCYPSFHTSMTVVMIAVCFLYKVRFRVTVLLLGMTIILATYALGIHWIPDIIAGIGVALVSVAWAVRLNRKLEAQEDGTADGRFQPVAA